MLAEKVINLAPKGTPAVHVLPPAAHQTFRDNGLLLGINDAVYQQLERKIDTLHLGPREIILEKNGRKWRPNCRTKPVAPTCGR